MSRTLDLRSQVLFLALSLSSSLKCSLTVGHQDLLCLEYHVCEDGMEPDDQLVAIPVVEYTDCGVGILKALHKKTYSAHSASTGLLAQHQQLAGSRLGRPDSGRDLPPSAPGLIC